MGMSIHRNEKAYITQTPSLTKEDVAQQCQPSSLMDHAISQPE